jgi:hypothetical protein
MIVVKIMGGLGNQMFQYAFGRAIALHYGSELFFDLNLYNEYKKDNNINYTPRDYGLSHFKNVNLSPMTPYISKRLFGNRLLNYIKFRLNIKRKSIYQEKAFSDNKEVFNLTNSAYLLGYWQSEKYFYDIRRAIREDFVFNYENIGVKNDELLFKIRENSSSVSLHVRRGDYLTINNFLVFTMEYYLEAIQIIKKKIPNPLFFLFSDDPQWVNDQLKPLVENSVLVDNNFHEDSWKDMMLMSNCSHHIIANSSFSWWGAWLGSNPDKMVIAPKKWFADDRINTSDLCPPDWILI